MHKSKQDKKLILVPFFALETLLYKIRDAFWQYPDLFGEDSYQRYYLTKLYKTTIPYSHMFVAFLFAISSFTLLFVTGTPKILGYSQDTLIEAVVMGVDSDGNVQKLNKINPLLQSNIQLEKDLVNIIYEPLLRYEYIDRGDGRFVGGIEYVLADDVITFKPGADYQFKLREDVFWHDSKTQNTNNVNPSLIKQFTADDVVRTFEIISSVNSTEEGNNNTNAYSRALKQLHWEKVDTFTVRICTKPADQSDIASCDSNTSNTILSNFLELLSFKIIPAHLSDDITPENINTNQPRLFRSPVGTGKFVFENVGDSNISLKLHKDYHDKIDSDIKKIRFQFYKTLDEATSAVQNGEAHTIASLSTEFKNSFAEYPQIEIFNSPVLYNQFWSLYFNLRKTPDGSSIAPESLQDVKVRQAISAAINRQSIIDDALSEVGKEALGPIPSISFFFNKNASWKTFKSVNSEKLLDDAGWTLKRGNSFRTNEAGEELQFSLYFVDSFDRRKVAEAIKVDLANIGVNVVIDRREQQGQDQNGPEGWDLDELNNQVLSPRLFDVVLYGMNTFIDPDRYELYHSSQIDHPGLNIAGYVSTEETVDKNEDREEGESSVIRVPKVDKFLEQARSFDPENNQKERQERYFDVQSLIADDTPVVYLYHPQFIYFANNAVQGIDLSGVNNVEDRFLNIENWELN